MSRSILVKSSGVRGSGQNKNCHVSFFVVPSYRKFASRYESEDDESDDDSLGGDQDYETMSNHGGTKKIINKGRWNKEEVSDGDLNLLTWSNGIKLKNLSRGGTLVPHLRDHSHPLVFQCPKLSFYFVHFPKNCTRKLLHAHSKYIAIISS